MWEKLFPQRNLGVVRVVLFLPGLRGRHFALNRDRRETCAAQLLPPFGFRAHDGISGNSSSGPPTQSGTTTKLLAVEGKSAAPTAWKIVGPMWV
jgi:hypothetical protein